MTTCRVPACDRSDITGDTLCRKHYQRMRRTGSPEGITVERRFWRHVTKAPNGCWVWDKPGSRGYGQFFGPAHRWAYERFVGPIPAGLDLDHLCRNRACVNPAHLDPVTCQENLLRSPVTLASINAAKTHCLRGHAFTAKNTYLTKDGRRQCRQCIAIRDAKHQLRRAERRAAA